MRARKITRAVLKLPPQALEIVRSLPRFGAFVFGSATSFNYALRKNRLDEASGVRGWTIHDLRRSARSLLSRAGVRPDIAERCLGHSVGNAIE